MSFQFVQVNPDDPQPNAETQRRIRSQAMRDYRRRQRINELEEATISSPEPSPSSLSSPQESSESHSRQESRRRKSSTQSLPIQPGPPRRQSSGTSRDDLPHIEDLDVSRNKRRSSQPIVRDSRQPDSPRRRKRPDEPGPQYGTFSSFPINLPKPPKQSSSISEDIDPLSSPGQLEQMLSICDSYNRWLLSHVPGEPGHTQISGPWDNPTSQMLLFALCLQSIGHMDAVQFEQSAVNQELFKTKVLALVNRRFSNKAKLLEDKTIGALACLTSYEISRGSSFDAKLHLKGLSQIIRLRGGTSKIGERGGLYMFLEILDLIHAVYFHSSPMYTSPDKSQPTSSEETPALQAVDETGSIDQTALDEISNFILSIPNMAESDEHLPDSIQVESNATPPGLETELEQWRQALSHAKQNIASSNSGALAYACGLAEGLHLATTSAIAPHPMRLQSEAEELFSAMLSLSDETWEAFQMLHIRILLTALSTSRDLTQKSWYNAHLTRRLYRSDCEGWSATKSLILSFIFMQKAARQPKAQAVRALANDIEIVVDASEARAKGMEIQTFVV